MKPSHALAVIGIVGLIASSGGAGPVLAGVTQTGSADEGPAYVAYYWRARPGKLADYNAYIQGTAERIDEDARKAGVFLEVTTVLPSPTADGPAPDWTHLRIFKLKNIDAVAGLGPGLDAATLRVVPDATQRKTNSARSAEMRDFVRREVWTTIR